MAAPDWAHGNELHWLGNMGEALPLLGVWRLASGVEGTQAFNRVLPAFLS
jgi:hypothetical protein